jgi:hypothetical protein
MQRINVARITTEARHTTTVKLTLEDEAGNKETIDARVVYRGMSLKAVTELQDKLKEKDGRQSLIKGLAEVVIALPDFGDADGNEVKPTPEFFDSLDGRVLIAINRAITKDNDPE